VRGWLLCLLWLPLWVQAGEGLAAVQARLQPVVVLRGEFAQERHIDGFRNPLRSAGRFLLSRERGVVWRSERPFPSIMVLDARGLRVDGIDQAVPDPALQRVQRLLLAMIGGDLDALAADFVLQAEPDGARWRLSATPRDPLLAQRLRGLELRGDRWVDEVRYTDEQGNATTIRFTAQNASPAGLSADELAAFD
jgi:hypothetical protein